MQSIYIPSRIQDWYREDKIWAKDRRYSLRLWILWTQSTEDPDKIDLEAQHLAWYHHKKWNRHQNTVYWVDRKTCSDRKDLSSIKHDRTQSSFTTHSQAYCIPKGYSWWKLEKSYTRKYMRHLDLLRRFPFKDNWMEELGSAVAGGGEDSQQTEPKSKTQLLSTVRLVKSEQTSGSLTQEIEKGVLFGCESTNVSTRRPLKSCVPVSVERLDKDKDADDNVDAHHVSTGDLWRVDKPSVCSHSARK